MAGATWFVFYEESGRFSMRVEETAADAKATAQMVTNQQLGRTATAAGVIKVIETEKTAHLTWYRRTGQKPVIASGSVMTPNPLALSLIPGDLESLVLRQQLHEADLVAFLGQMGVPVPASRSEARRGCLGLFALLFA